MMPAVREPSHRGIATEQCRPLMFVTEGPATLFVIELEERAVSHFWQRYGGIHRWYVLYWHDRVDHCGGATWRPLFRLHLVLFCKPAGNKLRRRNRIAIPQTDPRDRFNRREI